MRWSEIKIKPQSLSIEIVIGNRDFVACEFFHETLSQSR